MMDEKSSSIISEQHDGSGDVELQQPIADPVMETKLSDINIDCQESIFKYLGLVDLLNIADTKKQFKTVATLVFAKKFAKESVIVNELNPSRNNSQNIENIKKIEYAKTCFQILRNFGHLITVLKLQPSYYYENPRQKELYQIHFKRAIIYINEFCAESLREIHITPCSKGALKLLKPLLNVETVDMDSSGVVGLSKGSLNTLFPKLHRLKYHFDESPAVILESHFPHLEILDVRRNFGLNAWDNVSAKVLDLNPQLRKLSITIRTNKDILRSIAQLQHLEELQLERAIAYDSAFDDEIFHLKYVKKFEIIFTSIRNSHFLPEIPFTFERLEKFSMLLSNTFDLEQLYIFLNGNPTIVELNLRMNFSFFNLPKISRSLRSLRDFKIDSYTGFSTDSIISFITELPLLKKACFTSFKNVDGAFEQLQRLSGNEWHASIDSETVTLERSI